MQATLTPPVAQTATINGQEITPMIGDVVYVGNELIGRMLIEGDEAIPGINWEGCQFRTKSQRNNNTAAVNVKITGRTKQIVNDNVCVRCQIEFVNHGEENITHGGWLRIDGYNRS